jgi:cell division protein FtsB
MKVNLGIWGLLNRLVLGLLFLALVIGVVLWYVPLIQRNERMRKEIFRLNEAVRVEEEKAAQLKSAIDSVRTDPKAVERLARERLGYAKPGETVVRFQEPPPAPTQVPAPPAPAK